MKPHQRVVVMLEVVRMIEGGELKCVGTVVDEKAGKREVLLDFSQVKVCGTASAYVQQVTNCLIDREHAEKR